jgi:hypothetical protein
VAWGFRENLEASSSSSSFPLASFRAAPRVAEEREVGREGTRGCGGLCSGEGRGSGRLGERDLVFLLADAPPRCVRVGISLRLMRLARPPAAAAGGCEGSRRWGAGGARGGPREARV